MTTNYYDSFGKRNVPFKQGLTSDEVEKICEELTTHNPCSSLTAAISYFTIGEPITNSPETYWATSFTFLLIVLAANEVPYEC